MLDLLKDLEQEVRKVAPIHGIKINPLAADFNGATQAEQDAANAIIAGFDVEYQSAVKAIKLQAMRDILEKAPEWKQRNALARTLELTEKIARGNTLTQAEEDELAEYRSLWGEIKAIREQSDEDEAAL